jgi:hypothetical protein
MKILIIIVIFAFKVDFIYADDSIYGNPPYQEDCYYGITLGTNFLINNYDFGFSPNIDIIYCIFNFSSNIYFQKNNNPSYNFYTGIGLVNLLQVQYGTNFSDNRIKINSILPILSPNWYFWEFKRKWYHRLNLQFHYEINLNSSRLNNFGVGISFLILQPEIPNFTPL